MTKKGSTLLKKADGEEEEKHVEVRLEVSLASSPSPILNLDSHSPAKVEKVPGSGGKEDEINIGMEVVVDPDDPNQKPMTTYVEAQVNIYLKSWF